MSKRLRFAIFNRDGFTCKYCGRQSDSVTMHVDHILPVSKGGTNDMENLLTACSDCNLGKADKSITTPLPVDYLKRKQELSEQQLAAKESMKAHRARQKRKTQFEAYWKEMTCATYPHASTMNTIFSYVEEFGEALVYRWIEKAATKGGTEQNIGRYISGIRRKSIEQGDIRK